jgi:glycosyltransferase involved in cell wall biosynthesis
MTNPAVSIVMPLWNPSADALTEAIASIEAQTIVAWELVIVEDPSESCAADVLLQFSDPRIRYIRNAERTSFAQQLNQGLALSGAPLIARMDGDDICEPHRLAVQLEFLNDNPQIDVVGSNLTVIDGQGRPLGTRSYPAAHDQISEALERYNPIAHPAVMFRRAAIVEAGGYQGDMFTADYELWHRLIQRGSELANLQEPLLRYRIHPAGMKSARLKEMIRATVAVKRQYWTGRGSLRARLRIIAERMLLLLPAPLVLQCFLLTHVGLRRR